MTIDEALDEIDLWTGVDDRERRREVLTALVSAAEERGRALVHSVCDTLGVDHTRDETVEQALARVLAAHGREAAAKAWAEGAGAAYDDCIAYGARCFGKNANFVYDLRDMRAAALRGKEGTE